MPKKLPIHIIPDPVLRAVAQPVKEVDARIAELMEDMLETMYPANGMGLAAPQVGLLERVIVVDVEQEANRAKALRMANPEILWKSEETYTHNEGCLSIPDQYANITRPKRIRVSYLDEKNRKQELEAENVLAICIQHEIDHLNGVLFIDYLSQMKRDMMVRKVGKAKRRGDLPIY